MSYRSFDLKAKELGYWRVTVWNVEGEHEHYLTLKESDARYIQSALLNDGTGRAVSIESPNEWEPRA